MSAQLAVLARVAVAGLLLGAVQRWPLRRHGGLTASEQLASAFSIGLAFTIALPLGVGWTALWLWLVRNDRASDAPPWWPIAIPAAVILLVTPSTPLVWDEFVWLTKVKLGALGQLRTVALTHEGDAIPEGYPLGFPLWAAWLGGGHDVLGAAWVRIACAGIFVSALQRHAPARARWAALLIGSTPLVSVHARLAYVDLPVGLLSAALFLELTAAQPSPLRAALYGALLASFKDEGLAHIAVLGAYALAAQGRRASLAAIAALSAGVLFFGGWRIVCHAHGIVDADHALGAPAWWEVDELIAGLGRHLGDLLSFGGLWPATIAAAIWSLRARSHRAPFVCLALLTIVLCAGVILGPPRVREFARLGTLLGRMLLQLVPLASVLVAGVLTAASPQEPAARDAHATP